MMLEDFPGCCSIKVAEGFGNGSNTEWTREPAHTVPQAVDRIHEYLRISRINGDCAVVITVNSSQKILIAAMREIEEEYCDYLYATPWMKSRKHDTLVRLWTLQCQTTPKKSSLVDWDVTNKLE